MSKTKDKVIEQLNKGEFLIIGSDNFWYGSGTETLKDAIEEVKTIKKNISNYGDPENGEQQTTVPRSFYIYQANLIKEIQNYD